MKRKSWFLVLAFCCCGGDSKEPEDKMTARQAAAVVSDVAMQAYFVKIKMAAQRYHAQNGAWPESTDQMVQQEMLDPGAAKDPWGNAWVLEVIDGNLTVTSYGLDGKPGGTDENRDRMSR